MICLLLPVVSMIMGIFLSIHVSIFKEPILIKNTGDVGLFDAGKHDSYYLSAKYY